MPCAWVTLLSSMRKRLVFFRLRDPEYSGQTVGPPNCIFSAVTWKIACAVKLKVHSQSTQFWTPWVTKLKQHCKAVTLQWREKMYRNKQECSGWICRGTSVLTCSQGQPSECTGIAHWTSSVFSSLCVWEAILNFWWNSFLLTAYIAWEVPARVFGLSPGFVQIRWFLLSVAQ